MSEGTLRDPEQMREWNGVACVRFKWFSPISQGRTKLIDTGTRHFSLQPELESPGDTLRALVQANGIAVLNVAGPRLSREAFIAEFVVEMLDAAHGD